MNFDETELFISININIRKIHEQLRRIADVIQERLDDANRT